MFSEEFCFRNGSFECLLFTNNSTCDIDDLVFSEEISQANKYFVGDSNMEGVNKKVCPDILLPERESLCYHEEDNHLSIQYIVESTISDYIESNPWYDIGANLLNAFYYAFIFKSAPISASSLVAFKALQYYQVFENFCSKEYELVGYSICDVLEEGLYANLLYYSGEGVSKIRKEHFSSIDKTLFKNIERTLRKTDLSGKRVKKEFSELSKLSDYMPTLSFVTSSESTESIIGGAIEHMVRPELQQISTLFVSKVVGQSAKESTKYHLYGESADYNDVSKKVFMLTSCGTILPDFKRSFIQNHLYGYCLDGAGYVFSNIAEQANLSSISEQANFSNISEQANFSNISRESKD